MRKRLLAATGGGLAIGVIGVDDADLPALARGPRRHEFLLRATGSDHAAVAEIRAAQRLIAG